MRGLGIPAPVVEARNTETRFRAMAATADVPAALRLLDRLDAEDAAA